MDTAIQAEIDRIKAGPQSGWFTFLHHEGPIIESSSNVMERVEFIVAEKRQEEILIRLQHIWHITAVALKAFQEVTAPAWKTYQEATTPAWTAFQEVTAPAWAAYHEVTTIAEKEILALIPNCKWNGKTILE